MLSNQESSTRCQPETNQNISEESSVILSHLDGHQNAQQQQQRTIEEVQIPAEDLQLSSDEIQKLKCRSFWSRGDSCYHSASYSESGLSPEEEEEEREQEVEDNVFQEVICLYSMSDTSGAVSFDDEVDVEDGEMSRQ